MHRYLLAFVACAFFSACAATNGEVPRGTALPAQPGAVSSRKPAPDITWTERVITDADLLNVCEGDPTLDIVACWEILARLNVKSQMHVADDIRNGRPLKVPNDFGAYKAWTPLPVSLASAGRTDKFVLIVLDIPFLGWYEGGRLMGDSQISVGRRGQRTQAGFYRIEEKDADHNSRSYRNVFGNAAWMPWAMRIYGAVWIHEGDVVDGYSSRGCVYLPGEAAEMLYRWAALGTPVVVLDTLGDLDGVLKNRL